MKILIGIFFILILAFLTLKLKINVKWIEKEKNSLKIKFNINLGLYFAGIIKILAISLKEDGVHFLCFRFPYNIVKMDKDSMKILKDFPVFKMLKSLNLKLEQLYFDLELGCEDMIFTTFSVFAISTIVSILFAQQAKQISPKKFHYQIAPVYNTNTLRFRISTKICVKISNLLKILSSLQKYRKIKKQNKISMKKVPIKI